MAAATQQQQQQQQQQVNVKEQAKQQLQRHLLACKVVCEDEVKLAHLQYGITYYQLRALMKETWPGINHFKIHFLVRLIAVCLFEQQLAVDPDCVERALE